jgi:hypothetical protein
MYFRQTVKSYSQEFLEEPFLDVISLKELHVLIMNDTSIVDLSPLTFDFLLQPHHPHPSKPYESDRRDAYVPDTEEGRKVLMLLLIAFRRRLVFIISESMTRQGVEGVVWGDIHHKTKMDGGKEK